MSIEVEHEDLEELKSWGLGLENVLERCVFCKEHTRYWHLPTNNPCCEFCATYKSVEDLPQ